MFGLTQIGVYKDVWFDSDLECTKMFGLTQIGVYKDIWFDSDWSQYKDVWFDSDWSVQTCLV